MLLLPAQTRYEMAGGVTETSTERRVIFSPEIRGPRVGAARPEWDIFGELAARARPELAEKVRFGGTQEIREEIARVVPSYALIRTLREEGDQFQYGGSMLCAGWQFPTPDGRAHWSAIKLPSRHVPAGAFLVTTRRGRQFNSMVQGDRDSHTGARRDSVLVNRYDAAELGVSDGDPVVLKSPTGELKGRVLLAPVARGTLHVHWPEGDVLVDPQVRSVESGIPDYTAVVQVEVPRGV